MSAIRAKMSAEQRAAFDKKVAEKNAQDDLSEDGMLLLNEPYDSRALPRDLTIDRKHQQTSSTLAFSNTLFTLPNSPLSL